MQRVCGGQGTVLRSWLYPSTVEVLGRQLSSLGLCRESVPTLGAIHPQALFSSRQGFTASFRAAWNFLFFYLRILGAGSQTCDPLQVCECHMNTFLFSVVHQGEELLNPVGLHVDVQNGSPLCIPL